MPPSSAARRKEYNHKRYLQNLSPAGRAKAELALEKRKTTPLRSDRKNAQERQVYKLKRIAAAEAAEEAMEKRPGVNMATETVRLAQVDGDEMMAECSGRDPELMVPAKPGCQGRGWARKFFAAWWTKLVWWTTVAQAGTPQAETPGRGTVSGDSGGQSMVPTGSRTTRASAVASALGLTDSGHTDSGLTDSASGQDGHCQVPPSLHAAAPVWRWPSSPDGSAGRLSCPLALADPTTPGAPRGHHEGGPANCDHASPPQHPPIHGDPRPHTRAPAHGTCVAA